MAVLPKPGRTGQCGADAGALAEYRTGERILSKGTRDAEDCKYFCT